MPTDDAVLTHLQGRSLSGDSVPVELAVDRRSALRVGLVLGAGAVLAGCSSSGGSRSSTRRQPLPRPTGGMTASSGAAGGAAREPEFVSHKPAWLDGWKSGQGQPMAGVEPRRGWAKYGPNPRNANVMGSITRMTVHHDGMNAFTSTDRSSAAERIENIRSAHVGQGWADIGYHYIIDPAGRVWEGRPTSLQGAHVRDNNPGNLGIMVMGNYNKQAVTGSSQSALRATIATMMRQYRIERSRVYTHQELVATECPGTSLQRAMVSIRAGALA